VGSILANEPDPFRALAEMRTPGVILRGAYPQDDIPKLVARLIERGLMRAPTDPVELTADGSLSDVTRDAEGRVFKGSKYVREGANGRQPPIPGRGHPAGTRGWTPSRIDIGTTFGGGGWSDKTGQADREGFLAHSAGTHKLFGPLFDGMADPVRVLYDCCASLTNDRQSVVVAHEADGRQYGPAVFRVHYGGHECTWRLYALLSPTVVLTVLGFAADQPHINHVGQTERARRLYNLPPPKSEHVGAFEAFRFDHQMAALLCVQHTTVPSDAVGTTLNGTETTALPQAVVHRLRPSAAAADHLSSGSFGEFLAREKVQSATLQVEPGVSQSVPRTVHCPMLLCAPAATLLNPAFPCHV
jgi:hypothetical protein